MYSDMILLFEPLFLERLLILLNIDLFYLLAKPSIEFEFITLYIMLHNVSFETYTQTSGSMS